MSSTSRSLSGVAATWLASQSLFVVRVMSRFRSCKAALMLGKPRMACRLGIRLTSPLPFTAVSKRTLKVSTEAFSLMIPTNYPNHKNSFHSTSKRKICAKKSTSGFNGKSSRGEKSKSAQKRMSLLKSNWNVPNEMKKKRIVVMQSKPRCECKKSRGLPHSMLLKLKLLPPVSNLQRSSWKESIMKATFEINTCK